MTNYEKFKREIEALGYDFGVTKTQEIFFCPTMECANCIFKDSCVSSKVRWLYEEAKEIFPITIKEKHFLEFFKESYYVARDGNGHLFIYNRKPVQLSGYWSLNEYGEGVDDTMFSIKPDFFSFITWESDKCWSVAELLRMPVKE